MLVGHVQENINKPEFVKIEGSLLPGNLKLNVTSK